MKLFLKKFKSDSTKLGAGEEVRMGLGEVERDRGSEYDPNTVYSGC